MSAADKAAAGMERRRGDLFDAQVFQAPDRTDDIQDAVDGADFMEVYLVDGDAMHLGFGFCQGLEYGQALGLDIVLDRRTFDDLGNFRKAPVLMVMMMARHIDEMALAGQLFPMMRVVFMVFVSLFMVVMLMMVVSPVVMTFCIEEDIIIDRLDAQLVDTVAHQVIAHQVQRGHGLFKGFKGNAGLDEHADEHIAADTGKAIEV